MIEADTFDGRVSVRISVRFRSDTFTIRLTQFTGQPDIRLAYFCPVGSIRFEVRWCSAIRSFILK